MARVEGQSLTHDSVVGLARTEPEVERTIPVVGEAWMSSGDSLCPGYEDQKSGDGRWHREGRMHVAFPDASARRKLDEHGDRPPLGLEDRLGHVAEILSVHLQRQRAVALDLDPVEIVPS